MKKLFLFLAFYIIVLFGWTQTISSHDWKSIHITDEMTDLPDCKTDSCNTYNDLPSWKMQGYYAFASVQDNIPNLYAEKMIIGGFVRIDSLNGNFGINILTWSGEERYEDMHLGTYSFTSSEVNPGEWIPFNISIPLCKQMKLYDVEAKIKGTGTVWLSDFKVTYKGQQTKASNSKRLLPNTDNQYEKGSGFFIQMPLSDVEIDNLSILGRVWGGLKYYHPAVREGYYDWDNELFTILPRVYNVSRDERNRILYDWIKNLGEFTFDMDSVVNASLLWVYDTNTFGDELSNLLQKVACSRRMPFCYYAYTLPRIGTVEDRNEKRYENMDFTDDGIKLLAAYRLWNFVEYFYPYKKLADRPWDIALSKAISLMPQVSTQEEYSDVLDAITKFTDDSHSNIIYRPENQSKYLSYLENSRKKLPYGVPFITDKYLEGKYLVTYSFGEEDNDLRRGDAILALNDQSVDDFIAEHSTIAASNSGRYRRDLAMFVTFLPSSARVTYTVDRNGKILKLSPKLFKVSEILKKGNENGVKDRPKVYYHGQGLTAFDVIKDSIAYINVEKLSEAELNKSLAYNKIIIDLRGSESYDFGPWLHQLLPDIKPIALGYLPDLQNPGTFKNIGFTDMTYKGIHAEKRRILILVDENTQSSAEYCAMILQTSPYVKTIGSQTAGADGNVVEIDLPGEYVLMIGSMGLTYPDGKQCQRVGIHLDEEVHQTLESFRANSDAVIERAVELLGM